MNEALTPSGFMEQYEFIDRKIPVRLIAEMRNRFDALEVEGVGSWKMLCDEVANLDVEKKVNQNRLYVVQACAEVLLEKISTKKSYDDLYWDQRVQQLNSPEEFWQLFALLNVAFEDVFSSAWFRNNGYDRFYKAISEGQRFGVWNNFLEYIGADNIKNSYHVSDRKLINRVVGCKMPDDFIKLFREEGISDDKWHSSHWLQANGYRGLCSAISDIRFDTWSNFLGFMKVEKEIGIQGNEWLSSFWLENNGYRRLYRAIVNDARFNSWSTFLEFMSVECDGSWTKRVAVRKTPDDFIKFFKEIGIQGNEWKNSKWLDTNGFPGLRMAITEDIRFESWSAFLAFMDPEAIHEDEEMEQLATLSVEEAVALLGERDPYKLKIFLQFAHPELTEEEIDKLVRRAFKNFVISTQETREEKYLRYEEGLLQVQFHEFPRETEEPTVTITGRVKGEFVYCAGVYTKRTRLEDDGTFSFCIPLKIGETNEVRIMAVNTRDPENPVRSVQRIFTIEQTGEEEDDVESLFALLSQHAREIREGIRQDPGRLEHFEWCAEQVLIKKFSSSFEEGEEYVKELIVKTESGTIRKVLRKTLTKFRKINKMPFPNVQEGSLLFFQKYCVVEILRRMKDESCLGVILANDPGLGKTRTVLAAIAEYEAGIICPNAVVSVWGEEVNEVLENPDMLVMREVPHKVRKEMLRIRRAVHEVMSPARYVTNINFLQKIKDKERFSLLGDKKMVLVHDEAHSRVNEHSEQSKGARMIDHKFQINVTATPAKNPEAVRRLLR
ncbi:MAG: DEAD/DEAH box helicase family protein, partial [Candidatus Peribacteraceae bacterium]|nr:DEAD/DEAH box helicase family protein [Candidatus Peribacteraceae bacterium]